MEKNTKRRFFKRIKVGFRAKRVKSEKYEALNKAVKKRLLFSRSEDVPVSGLLKEKALEFPDELSIEGFQ